MSTSFLHLLHRACQVADLAFSSRAAAAAVTTRQAAVLAAIAVRDEPSQSDLVAATGIDRSTMADVVRRLMRQGLVARKRTRGDARRYAVRLTEKGQVAVALARDAEQAAERELMKRLPPSLRESFSEGLRFMALGKVAKTPADVTLVAAE